MKYYILHYRLRYQKDCSSQKMLFISSNKRSVREKFNCLYNNNKDHAILKIESIKIKKEVLR